jgi:hypothetical protein
MAMVAAAMANSIISALNGVDDFSQVGDKLSKAVSDYIKSNATILYAWVGVNPSSGAPDPVVTFTATPASPIAPFVMPQGATDPALAMTALGAALSSYISSMLVNPPSDFTISPLNIIAVISLSPSGATAQLPAMTAMAGQIISGLTCTPAGAGAHAAFTGAATFTSIL